MLQDDGEQVDRGHNVMESVQLIKSWIVSGREVISIGEGSVQRVRRM